MKGTNPLLKGSKCSKKSICRPRQRRMSELQRQPGAILPQKFTEHDNDYENSTSLQNYFHQITGINNPLNADLSQIRDSGVVFDICQGVLKRGPIEYQFIYSKKEGFEFSEPRITRTAELQENDGQLRLTNFLRYTSKKQPAPIRKSCKFCKRSLRNSASRKDHCGPVCKRKYTSRQ